MTAMDAQKARHLLLGAFAGLLAGFVLFEDSVENRQSRSEGNQLQSAANGSSFSGPSARSYVREVPRGLAPKRAFSETISLQQRPTNTLPFEITEEDQRLIEELENRRRNGDFVNKLENPVQRKMLRHLISNSVQVLADRNRTNLEPLFARLNVSDETSDKLRAHISKINDAAMQTQASLGQLLDARAAYDKRARSLLSPEAYEKYRKFEESGPARSEFQKIQRFAEEEKVPVDKDERDSLIAIIHEAQAYPKQSYLGPYDGLPPVAVGKENVLRSAEERMLEVREGANRAIETAAERGLSESTINLLFKYYSQDVQKRFEEIERIRDPRTEERIKAEAHRRLLEQMERLQKQRAQEQDPVP